MDDEFAWLKGTSLGVGLLILAYFLKWVAGRKKSSCTETVSFSVDASPLLEHSGSVGGGSLQALRGGRVGAPKSKSATFHPKTGSNASPKESLPLPTLDIV